MVVMMVISRLGGDWNKHQCSHRHQTKHNPFHGSRPLLKIVNPCSGLATTGILIKREACQSQRMAQFADYFCRAMVIPRRNAKASAVNLINERREADTKPHRSVIALAEKV
jgi:hypothetical protein